MSQLLKRLIGLLVVLYFKKQKNSKEGEVALKSLENPSLDIHWTHQLDLKGKRFLTKKELEEQIAILSEDEILLISCFICMENDVFWLYQYNQSGAEWIIDPSNKVINTQIYFSYLKYYRAQKVVVPLMVIDQEIEFRNYILTKTLRPEIKERVEITEETSNE